MANAPAANEGAGRREKTPFVAAVESPQDGRPVSIKLERVSAFSNQALSAFAKRCLGPSCSVISDGLQCFASVTDAGRTHQAIKTGSGVAAVRKPAFKWVNTALGNMGSPDDLFKIVGMDGSGLGCSQPQFWHSMPWGRPSQQF